MARLLVVDDDMRVADAVHLVLSEDGHVVKVATSIAAAQTMLDKEQFDGAVLDVWLDTDNGLDLAGEIAKLESRLPFIVMSGGGPGKTLEAVTAKADALGARAVLFKPFDDDELLAAVAKMLD